MKQFFKVSARSSKLKWPSSNYISEFSIKEDFNLNCKIIERDLCRGIFNTDTYKICLEGTQKNIQSYISFLFVIFYFLTVFSKKLSKKEKERVGTRNIQHKL